MEKRFKYSKDPNIISSGMGSYADVMHRILIHKKWTEFPRHMIAGMTATVFRLVVDRHLTEESISAYNWMAENFVAADFIGVTASQAAGFHLHRRFLCIKNRHWWTLSHPLIGVWGP
ncbi:hypothetical protein ABGV42_04730 [Paenibacillus pabuli]|uniref:hypothetical protein n=1 Tax=Paenibacillus pabuli TaxID=1472 RepID=UPI0032422D9E